MARRKKTPVKTTDFRHDSAKRTNIPPAKIAGEGKIPDVGKQKYSYSPHLLPVLRFDPEARADKVREVVEKACSGKSLDEDEKEILRAVGTHWEYPSLEWAGKKEEHDRHWRTVDPVALHIHERVSANAILSAAKRKDVERSLFADPELEYQQAVQFYKHDMDWANRLILGDSLEVMSSLARREDLAGKVQMIYIDPPYGIGFGSNFQPEVGKREVKDRDDDLTREPEMVKAYRDTWSLGLHSYLCYLRDRLIVARQLLADTGSIFVQISDENLHRVRDVMDEVMGSENFCSVIPFSKTSGATPNLLPTICDFLLWYARDRSRAKYHRLFEARPAIHNPKERYVCVETNGGEIIDLSVGQKLGELPIPDGALLRLRPTDSQGASEDSNNPVRFEDKDYYPPKGRHWSVKSSGVQHAARAGAVYSVGNTLTWKSYRDELNYSPATNDWLDIKRSGFGRDKQYVVETAEEVIQRCILMTSNPGDLVLDPTCGSGTTAVVAERWGRRWITIDTSRVALALARQRVLVAQFELYRPATKSRGAPVSDAESGVDPAVGFTCRTVPRITLGSIAQNQDLEPIVAKHEPRLDQALASVNASLDAVSDELRERLVEKLAANMQADGIRSATKADHRRWLVPGTTRSQIAAAFTGKAKLRSKHVEQHAGLVPPNGKFEHWHVPFDTDPDWPESLSKAVTDYRNAWRAKMDEVNACIASNAEQEVLVDKPEVVKGVVRVAGPFTVEGVMPEELNIGEEGLFDGTPNEELDYAQLGEESGFEMQNLHAFLSSMVGHLKSDGVTFPDNKNPKFARVESLFDTDSASTLHAEGVWEGDDVDGPARVGVGFGPQYGPVTAKQVEELIREASRRGYDELVVAGFSFDAEAHAIIQEDPNPKVRVHMAQIRPDLNAGMDGLLKDTPSSQLFTVFGAPAIRVDQEGDEYTVTLEGVDIYDPVKNTVRSTGATKVAAWFLDSDYNGRTFCITQAFFPDQDAWGKLAKALKDVVEPEAFAAFKGTASLPFEAGEHGRIAVKVIDPRGSEVMTIHKLEG